MLQRVADGDDLSDPDDMPYRISARALQARGLVQVSRRGGVWRATITDAGRRYLDGGGPSEVTSAPARAPRHRATVAATDGPAVREEPARASARRAGRPALLAQARELVEQLVCDGEVRVEVEDEATRALYRRMIHAAKTGGMLPEGKVLRHAGRSRGGIVMKLYDKDAPDETDWNRIRLTAIHQLTAIDEIIDVLAHDRYVVTVSAEARPEALEFVRHLAQAARSRGHRLVLNTRPARPVLSLAVDGAELTVAIDEVYAQVPHVLTDDERRRKKREPWIRLPEYDRVPTGRLTLSVGRSWHGNPDTWTDEGKTTVKSRIETILTQVEEGVVEDRRRRAEAERQHRAEMEAYERQRAEERAQWERAKASARQQATENLRLQRLRDAMEGWAAAEAVRHFCEQLEQKWAGAGNHVDEWVTWARYRANRIDPLVNPTLLANVDFDLEPAPADLEPFMGEWSLTYPGKAYRSTDTERAHAAIREQTRTWHHGMRGNPQAWRWR